MPPQMVSFTERGYPDKQDQVTLSLKLARKKGSDQVIVK